VVLAAILGACGTGGKATTAATATTQMTASPAATPPIDGPAATTPAPPAATAPTTAGTPFTSTRYGYSLVVPEGWTVTETPGTGGLHPDEPGVDTFHGPGGRILSVVGEPVPPGTGLESWSCSIGKHLAGEHQTPVEATEVLIAAGQTTRLTKYHLHIDPYVIHYLNAEVINGETGLTLSMESTAHDDAADEAVFRAWLAGLRLV
jgi:hypothetical protein